MDGLILAILFILIVSIALYDFSTSGIKRDKSQNRRPEYIDMDAEYYEANSRPLAHRKTSIELLNSTRNGAKSYKTGALDKDKVHEVIERYREPVNSVNKSDGYSYRPVSFYSEDYKPVPPDENKSIIIGSKPPVDESSPSSIVPYKPNEIIASIIEETREEYQLPPGAVEMPREETAAIVAAILYFINEEPKIGITKLEYYIILLDKMCFDDTGKRLFSYRLTYGPFGYYIQNFRAFLDFIEDKKILSKRKKYYTRRKYRIDFTAHHEVPDELFPDNMLDWMDTILFAWRGAGAEHTKRGILQQFSSKQIAAFTE